MRSLIRSLFLLSLCVGSFGCEDQRIGRARELAEQDKTLEACQLFEAVVADIPEHPTLAQELENACREYTNHALNGQIEEFDWSKDFQTLVHYLTKAGDESGLRKAYDKKVEFASGKKDWKGAIDALKQASKHWSGGTDNRIAELLHKNPEIPQADQEFKTLLGKHPNDRGICARRAGWLGELRLYDDAIHEFERCQLIEGGTIEQSIYYGAQVATLKKDKKVAKRSYKRLPRKKK